MALALSATRPRNLAYAGGGLRSDLRLMEIDEELLQAITQEGGVHIKGDPGDEAVLCTATKTYALKLVETSNCLLLLPPTDDEFGATPRTSLGGNGRLSDASELRDIGLQTQLAKNAAADKAAPLVATATAKAHIELAEVAPRLDALPRLLGRPYGLDDEEQQQQQGEDDDEEERAAMDVDDDDGGASSSGGGFLTTEQLLERVQASRAELLAELERLQAVQLPAGSSGSSSGRRRRVWRLVDEAYLGALLEMLVAAALERGWPLDAVPAGAAAEALAPTGYRAALVRHCLRVYGRPVAAAAAAAVAAAAASADGSGSSGAPPSPSTHHQQQQQQQQQRDEGEDDAVAAVHHHHHHHHCAIDAAAACRHYARKLLARRPSWPLREFLAAWRDEVPPLWAPAQGMLAGEALVHTPEAADGSSGGGGGGGGEPRVRRLAAAALPTAPAPRFAALFRAQPRWTREQLAPYLLALRVPGQTVEQLLLRHARASQRSASDATVVFVAR